MNKKKVISAVVLGAMLAGAQVSTAVADEEFYGGVNYEMWSWDADGTKVNPAYLTAKVGKQISDGFSLEAKLGFGIVDDTNTETYNTFGGPINIDLTIDPKIYAGVFGVSSHSLNDNFQIYAKGGLNYFTLDIEASESSTGISAKESVSETKVALGIGADYFFNGKSGINLEVLAPSVADLGDVTTFSFGFVQKF